MLDVKVERRGYECECGCGCGDIVQTKPKGDYLGISKKGDEWRVVEGITSKWVDARRKQNKITTPIRGRATL